MASLKRPNIGFQDQLGLNAGQKYCREHSSILFTCIKLPFVIKIFILSILKGRFTKVLLCNDFVYMLIVYRAVRDVTFLN